MANTNSSRKRARQNDKRRMHNAGLRSKMRTFIKTVRYAIKAGDKEQAQTAYQKAQPVIDTMVSKGVIHKNTAARYKNRLVSRIKQLAS